MAIAAARSEGTRDTGLPEAGCSEPADAALRTGRPAAFAAFLDIQREAKE